MELRCRMRCERFAGGVKWTTEQTQMSGRKKNEMEIAG